MQEFFEEIASQYVNENVSLQKIIESYLEKRTRGLIEKIESEIDNTTSDVLYKMIGESSDD